MHLFPFSRSAVLPQKFSYRSWWCYGCCCCCCCWWHNRVNVPKNCWQPRWMTTHWSPLEMTRMKAFYSRYSNGGHLIVEPLGRRFLRLCSWIGWRCLFLFRSVAIIRSTRKTQTSANCQPQERGRERKREEWKMDSREPEPAPFRDLCTCAFYNNKEKE